MSDTTNDAVALSPQDRYFIMKIIESLEKKQKTIKGDK